MDQRPLSYRERQHRRVQATRNTVAVLLGINVSVLAFSMLFIGISRLPVFPVGDGRARIWAGGLIIVGIAVVALLAGAMVVRTVARFLSGSQGPDRASVGQVPLPESDPPGQPAGRRQLVPSRTSDDPPLG